MISLRQPDCAYFAAASAIETGPFVAGELTTRPVLAPATPIFRKPQSGCLVVYPSRCFITTVWMGSPPADASGHFLRKLDASAHFFASKLSKTGGGSAEEEAIGILIATLANPLFQGLLFSRP